MWQRLRKYFNLGKKHEKWGKRMKINKKYKDREVKGKAEWRNSKCKERKH